MTRLGVRGKEASNIMREEAVDGTEKIVSEGICWERTVHHGPQASLNISAQFVRLQGFCHSW